MLRIFIIIFSISACLQADLFIETLEIKELAPFRRPSERFIESEKEAHIQQTLQKNGVDLKYWDFWAAIIHQEERGLFGYHAATQHFRLFEDIVHMIFDELLELEIPKDFHFFRIPFDPILHEHPTALDFLDCYPLLHDGQSPIRDQIVSLNYCLYGNYATKFQCSVAYFADNVSAGDFAKNNWLEVIFGKKLELLFDALGIPKHEISAVLEIGQAIVNSKTGVIYQFFDLSRSDYHLVDKLCYPAVGMGKYDAHLTKRLSTLFASTQPFKFDFEHGQLRLIMNTAETLNPYRGLTIRRYDLLDHEMVQAYESTLRKKIRSLPRDPLKINQYKQKLRNYWHV